MRLCRAGWAPRGPESRRNRHTGGGGGRILLTVLVLFLASYTATLRGWLVIRGAMFAAVATSPTLRRRGEEEDERRPIFSLG